MSSNDIAGGTSKVRTKTKTVIEEAPETESGSESVPETESRSGSESGSEIEIETESEIEIEAETEIEPETETKTEIKTKTGTDRRPSWIANKLRWFREMPERKQDKGYFTADADKRGVYRQLMNHLDDVDGAYRIFSWTLTIVQLFVFFILMIALTCTLTIDKVSYRRFLHLKKWQYISMVMTVAVSPFVIRIVTFLLFCPVQWWWRIHKYVVYFIRQLKRYIDLTLWFCVVLFTWYAWFRPRLRDISETVAHHTTWLLSALCIGSFFWLLKNTLYLKLEADLHYDKLFDRIRASVVYLHGLQIIHSHGRWRFLPDNETKKKLMRTVTGKSTRRLIIPREDEIWRTGENIWRLVLEMKMESVPIWILLRLAEEYLDQVKLRPLPGKSDIVTKDDREILSEAKKMFRLLIKNETVDANSMRYLQIKLKDLEGSYGIDAVDLGYLFKPLNQQEEDDEAEEISSSTALKGERTISYYEFLNWAVLAFKTCWALKPTLNSSKRVFIKLNWLMNIFLVIMVFMLWLLLSGIMKIKVLVLLLTPVLAASFIFGDCCKKIFEGLVFAFAMHPFNSGDRVIIGNVEMRVTELNILTSCFHKYDTKEEVVIPNSTLTTTDIINLHITPSQSDKVEFFVSSQTPPEDAKDLEIKIKKYLDDEIEYSSKNMVVKSEVGDKDMKMIVYFKYFVSYVTAESVAMDKSMIVSKIMEFKKKMDKKLSKTDSTFYSLYSLDIFLACKVKLNAIEYLEKKILRGLEKKYSDSSKLVIRELTMSKVKIGIYIYSSDDTMVDRRGESAEAEMVTKNLRKIRKKLRRKKIVSEVKIIQLVDYDSDKETAFDWHRVR